MKITIIGHENMDTDCATAIAAVRYLTPAADKHEIVFDSRPDPARHDGVSTFIVDVGRGPLDHHQLDDPRSTCAFNLVCEHFIAHGDVWQRLRAMALLERLGPSVLRQDSTGSLDPEREVTVNVLGLPTTISTIVWEAQDDQVAWREIWPLLRRLFDQQVAAYEAEHAPESVLAQAAITVSPSKRVIGIAWTQVAGEISALSHMHRAVEIVYPDYQVSVSTTRWLDRSGKLVTISRGVGRNDRLRSINVQAVMDRLPLTGLSPAVQREIGTWIRLAFFAGAGGLKAPRADAPPNTLVAELLAALEACVK
jgi:hypothetical protein